MIALADEVFSYRTDPEQLDVNEAVIEKYPFIDGPWSFFHQDSPKKTIAVTGDHSVKWVQH